MNKIIKKMELLNPTGKRFNTMLHKYDIILQLNWLYLSSNHIILHIEAILYTRFHLFYFFIEIYIGEGSIILNELYD